MAMGLPSRENLKKWVVRHFFSYSVEGLAAQLAKCGLRSGDTLVVHSSWQTTNGFKGKPADLVRAFKGAVGPEGLLVMPSMPYHNMSSADWLRRGKAMDVRRTPSMMGMVSEAFRRSEGVLRSLSVTHPLLAWGQGAAEFIAGHEATDRPFGPASPFAKLLQRNALILGFDVPFASFTFTHFVEDLLADTMAIPLYEPELMSGTVVDSGGIAHEQSVRVLSAAANRLRREHRLVQKLRDSSVLHQQRLGNTSLTWIRAKALADGARALATGGAHFFDTPANETR